MNLCAHREHIKLFQLPDEVAGCEECLLAGTPWLHLRICLECGHVGCCDESPERHGQPTLMPVATRSFDRLSPRRNGPGATSTASGC